MSQTRMHETYDHDYAMNLARKISRLFRGRGAVKQYTSSAADILSYAAWLVDDRSQVENEIVALPRLQGLPAYNQRKLVPELYERFEAILCPRQYEPEALRAKIRENFTSEELQRSYIDVLLPAEQQAVRALEHSVSQASQKAYLLADKRQMETLLHKTTKSTLLEGTSVDPDGSLDFSVAEKHFFSLPPKWLPVVEELLRQLEAGFVSLSENAHAARAGTTTSMVGAIPVTPEARESFSSLGLQEFVEQGFMRDISFTVESGTGEEIPAALTGTTLKDDQGVIQGIVIVAKDMRKLQAYARARLNEITPILHKVSLGDFSQTIEVPAKQDEFTEHKIALRLMVENFKELIESIRQKTEELEEAKAGLEEKVAERTAELTKTQQKFKVLYESSADAVVTLEPPTWKFTSGNPAARKLFGVTDEGEFITLSPLDLAPEKQPDGQLSTDTMMSMIAQAMKKGSSFFQWMSKKYNGPEFPSTVLISRVTEGDKTYLQAVVRDLSELEKAKQSLEEQVAARTKELQELNKNLESEVAKRTKELETKLFELERFNKIAVDRELKMVELKKEIARLKGGPSQPSAEVAGLEQR